MYIEEIFIDHNELPETLTSDEIYELFIKMSQGYEEARKVLIEHNIRLVLYRVLNQFSDAKYDKKDLVSVGNIGLIKAINTFDISKNLKFTTYATRCIDNEILMFLRSNKKHFNTESFNKIVREDSDGHKLKLADIFSNNMDVVEDYEDKETHKIIQRIINELEYRDREIIIMYFGFCDNKRYTQHDIAERFGLSQSHVSRIINKIISKIAHKLEEQDIIELGEKTLIKCKKIL